MVLWGLSPKENNYMAEDQYLSANHPRKFSFKYSISTLKYVS
jgi:hypothetical protein